MTTTTKFKLATGQIVTYDIDPAFGVECTVPTDNVELKFKVAGPAGTTEEDTIGGRSRRD